MPTAGEMAWSANAGRGTAAPVDHRVYSKPHASWFAR
jgi:hypothetical protein